MYTNMSHLGLSSQSPLLSTATSFDLCPHYQPLQKEASLSQSQSGSGLGVET